MVPASVWQMLRGATLVLVAIMSVFILKRKLYRHHLTGLFLVVAGSALVGYSAIKYAQPSSND